jgi:hypothetical protein
MTSTFSLEDAKALDLLKAGGVLNANATLDKLMEVTRELSELNLTTATGLREYAWGVFITRAYVFNATR